MNKETLKSSLEKSGLFISNEDVESLYHLMVSTLETNKKFNLTAIKDNEQFMEKMIYDSALAILDLDLKNKKAIDVGTGAGFPGLVLSILCQDCSFTLLDSTTKKINYIEEYCKQNGINNVSAIADRAEEYARKNIEKYDYAFARAVASLQILLELIAPMLKVGGYFVALKGPGVDKEIRDSKRALKLLNMEVVGIKNYCLPESKEERNIVLIKKIDVTVNKYPRRYSEIKKRPL